MKLIKNLRNPTNHGQPLTLTIRICLALRLMAATAQAQIALQDGSPLIYTHVASTSLNQPFTVTAGAGVMVVLVEDRAANSTEPATLTWGGQTLTRDVQSSGLPSTTRSLAIYHLFNPTSGTANITGTVSGVSSIWMTAYTLNGVDTTIAPIAIGATSGGTSTTTSNLTIKITGTASNSWAAANVCYGSSTLSAFYINTTNSSGRAINSTTISDNSDDGTTAVAGYIPNLTAGTNIFAAGCTGGTKYVFAVDIFTSLGSALAISTPQAFGIKFLGNSDTTVNGTAGLVCISGWTNIATATFTSGTIYSSDGSAAATLTRSGPGVANLWHSSSAGDGSNGSLLDGYNDCQANSSTTNVISGLTGSAYTVYIYAAGDNVRPGNNTQYLPNYTVNGITYYTATVDGTGAFQGLVQGSVTAANSNVYPPPLTYGNYIVISNVVPVSGAITISANSANLTYRSPLNGIEIVTSTKGPLIQMPPSAQMVYTGNVAQLSVVIQGVNPLTYNWLKNGVSLNDGGSIYGSQTGNLTITNLALADAGDYTVIVTNNFGAVTSQVAHLSVVVPTLADTQIDAYNKAYLVQTNGLTYYTRGLTNRVADNGWTFSIDIEGEEDAFERTQSPQHQQLVNSLCTTWLIQSPPPWSGDSWNDDIGWFSLALVRGYQMTGNANFLAQAEYGFNMAFARGWDTNYNGGGIWEQQPTALSSNNPPTKNPLSCDSLLQATCMIYQSTTNAYYLSQAELIYSWVRTNIFNPNTGQVYGQIATNGVVDTSKQLYNQGTFVDCANLLHNITGQQMYYDDSLKAVEYARNNLTANGIFSNGATYIYTWAAEFCRGLGHFVKDNNLWSTYYPWMQANVTTSWNNRRTDYNVSWNVWPQPTPTTNDLSVGWAVNAVVIAQMTPASEPGLVNCTNQVNGTVIGTSGSWSNDGDTIGMVFDGNINTFFDGPDATGDWVGLDFGVGVSNVIGQINYWPRTGESERMLGGVFQGANNSTFNNPVTLFTIVTAPPEGGIFTSRTITNTEAFRYVRYIGPANGYCNVAELQFLSPNPPPAPIYLTDSWNGSQLTLTWPDNCRLLESTNVNGPWIINVSAASPFSVIPSQPQRFYRIQSQ